MKTFHRYALSLIVVALLAIALYARATSTAAKQDQKICTGTANSSGGTFTCDFPIPADRGVHIVADVGYSYVSGGHLAGMASIGCDAVFENQNGTVTLPNAITTSGGAAVNPLPAIGTSTSGKYEITARAEACDALFGSSGAGTAPICTWSVSSTNGRITVTNNGTTQNADITVWIHAFVFGSQ